MGFFLARNGPEGEPAGGSDPLILPQVSGGAGMGLGRLGSSSLAMVRRENLREARSRSSSRRFLAEQGWGWVDWVLLRSQWSGGEPAGGSDPLILPQVSGGAGMGLGRLGSSSLVMVRRENLREGRSRSSSRRFLAEPGWGWVDWVLLRS